MANNDRSRNIINKLNKALKKEIAFNLNEESPSNVKFWIPTGSRWLDSIINKDQVAGIPSGKIVLLEGLPSTGKSYLAAQIAINASKMDMDVVYFDTESSLDTSFLENMGMNLNDIVYVQAENIEMVLETIEQLLEMDDVPKLFIWDSLAMTPCKADQVGNFDPTSDMAKRPRILHKAMRKLEVPIAKKNSVFLILNQLYTNITSDMYAQRMEPYKSPGGQGVKHASSLTLWLTTRKNKDSFVYDSSGNVIGTEVKVTIEKSRFGSYKRSCFFKILWSGEKISIQDEESWIEVVKKHPMITTGTWWTIKYDDGTEEKFRSKDWHEKMTDTKFKNRVLQIMDDVLLKGVVKQSDDESEEE